MLTYVRLFSYNWVNYLLEGWNNEKVRCFNCQNQKSKVTNSRPTAKNSQTWRRRQCLRCDQEWSSYEAIDFAKSISVKYGTRKSDLRPLSRDFLLCTVFEPLNWRKDAKNISGSLTDTILGKVLQKSESVIDVDELNQIIFGVLSDFDPTAADVFATKNSLV